jgi:hypothetical protein
MKRITLVLSLLFVMLVAGAQDKLSPSTHLFLMERDGLVNFDAVADSAGTRLNGSTTRRTSTRPVARAQHINGVKMVAAFVRLTSDDTVPLERMGVIIQARFKNGIVSAMLPVDKIEEIAALENVKSVEVAAMATLDTDQSRALTYVDDILNGTADAQVADVLKRYDGTGIIVGVIDDGFHFNHTAYNDKNGNSRIKRAWILEGAYNFVEHESVADLTTDLLQVSHGTHTSTTAAGAPIDINGITYGGMAPNADIVLFSMREEIYESNIAIGIQKICDYADAVGKPCVINISLGSQYGTHDNSSTLAQVVEQYSSPQHIIVFSSGNEAGRKMYLHGTTSYNKPINTVLLTKYYANNPYYTIPDNWGYMGVTLAFYSRDIDQKMNVRLHVVDTTTNTVVWTSKEIVSKNGLQSINRDDTGEGDTPFRNYFHDPYDQTYVNNSYLRFFNSIDPNGKGYVIITMDNLVYEADQHPNFVWHCPYALALSIYPADSTHTMKVDGWACDSYSYFSSFDIEGFQSTSGTDSCSVNHFACAPAALSVGAYCGKKQVKDYKNSVWTMNAETLNDVTTYSSYCAEGAGPVGRPMPDICAPGTMVVSAMNRYDGNFMNDYLASSGNIRVNDDYENPYGTFSGTSMAAPCVTGIIALWQQAAIEAGREPLSVDEIREVFRETAIHDQWTDGEHSAQFGVTGKIDALAGLSYILKDVPGIRYSTDSLVFDTPYASIDTLTLLVKGNLLTRPITITQSESDVFTVLASDINVDGLDTITTVKVVYRPVAIGKDNATLTLSNGGETADVTVLLRGHCLPVAPVMLAPSDLQPTSMNTHWQDITPQENVESYTLEVSSAAFNELRLNEPFDGGADISSTTDCSSRLDEITATPGWTGSKVYHGEGTVTLGSASAKGWIMTPRLDMRGNNGLMTVKVKASALGNGIQSGPLSITVGERDTVITVTTDESEHIVLLPCPSSDTVRVRLSNGVKAARIKLHDLTIYAGDAYSPIDPSQISYHEGITDTTYTVTGITPGDYLLRVQATYTDGTASAWSNQVRAHLDWATGDVNRDGEVNIADVGSVIDGLLDGHPLPGCDVNGDGEINIADVNALINIILSH